MKKNVLVIGGTGFIGSEVIFQLQKEGKYNIYSFSRSKNVNCPSFIGNVEKIETLEKVYQEISVDVTLILYGLKSIAASVDIDKYSKNEIDGMINILDCCDKYNCKKIIYISSSAIYSSGENINEDSELELKSFYSFTKYTNENLLIWYKKIKNIDYEILRCFNVVGVTSQKRISNDIISLLLQNNRLDILGTDFNTFDGTLIRDYIHVKDVARAILKCIELNSSNILNVASGKGYSIKEIIELTKQYKLIDIKTSVLPKRAFDQDCLIANIQTTKEILDWYPVYSIENIIKDTADVIMELQN